MARIAYTAVVWLFKTVGWLLVAASALFLLELLLEVADRSSDFYKDVPTGATALVFFVLVGLGGYWLTRVSLGRTPKLEGQILRLAETNHGYVTPSEVALHCHVGLRRARQLLYGLVKDGAADLRHTEDMDEVFVFEGLLSLEEKRLARDLANEA